MESPYIIKFEDGKLSCELSEETKKMIEDDKREERRIENQEYQEECKHEIDNAAEELRDSELI